MSIRAIVLCLLGPDHFRLTRVHTEERPRPMKLSIVRSSPVDMELSSLISNVETAVRPFR